jgi:tRNA-Thr(GGU) m(6)t(6)A37 methyltransferase TsaA
MPRPLKLKPIGIIRSPFTQPAGTPIQPRTAAGAQGTVEVAEEYADGLKDLDGFERIWLLYWLDRAPEAILRVTPFLDHVERGVFACRAPCRPNPIGLSPVRLLRLDGRVLHVADLDVLDGTPLLDIKPYAAKFDCFETSRNGWLDEVAERPRATADGRFDRDSGGREA